MNVLRSVDLKMKVPEDSIAYSLLDNALQELQFGKNPDDIFKELTDLLNNVNQRDLASFQLILQHYNWWNRKFQDTIDVRSLIVDLKTILNK
jgi:hypothetical protein